MKDEYLSKELAEERERIDREREKIKDEHKGSRIEMMKRLGKIKVEMNKEKNTREIFLQNQLEMVEGEKKKMEEDMVKLTSEIEKKDEALVEVEVGFEERGEEIQGLKEEIKRLKGSLNKNKGELHHSLTRERLLLEGGDEGEYENLVETLMEGFNRERKEFKRKNVELKGLLQKALVDIVFLSKKVEALGGTN